MGALLGAGCGGFESGTDGSIGGCPFTLSVDGATYDAVRCQLQGGPTSAAHLYQIDLSAQFNDTPGMIRSVELTLRDDTDSAHAHDYVVGADSLHPSVDATYYPTSLDAGFSTLAGTAEVGSGTFTVTGYDTASKIFSGSYSITVKKGTDAKTITGTITNAPMTRAD
ncbi:MAG TPA: hypothetical protein VFQ65_27095 [Kofleriaceae bacterium]|nr:hypothetical protein [Kofleriaceae bacterium]